MPVRKRSLLEQVRGLIERTYDHQTGLGALAPFVGGDEGFRRLTAVPPTRRVGAPPGAEAAAGAQVLLRDGPDGSLRASLYFPTAMIATLEEEPPGRAVHGGNVDAFATFVEEIDHLLLVATRAREGRTLTLLELELHANVTKELVLRHFVARGSGVRPLPPEAIDWVRYHLFRKPEYCDEDPEVRRRYRDAARYAVRYLERLDRLPPGERLTDLRRFSRRSQRQKLRLVA